MAVAMRSGSEVRAVLQFGVLGPLQVARDGHDLAVKGPKLRVLLATLLVRANTAVPMSVIMRRLWDDDPPPSGRTTVQMYVLRLRRLLGDDLIATCPGGYVLRVPGDALDLSRFRDAVRAARAAVPADELSLLAKALSCRRGPVLDDLVSESLHREDVLPLTEELLRVRERFFDVSLELGRHRDIVGDLVRATEDHPWHEAFWAQLILALHRTGRRADALRAYGTVRARLAEELGVEPGIRLRQAHHAALMADETQAALPVVAQLPADVSQFIGRTAAIARLDELAFAPGGGHTIVVSGLPGVGKTALAVHVAHRWRDRFPDGQLYVNLQGFAAGPPLSASVALTRFLGALGFTHDRVPLDVEEQSALLRSALTGRRVLLVLDNAVDASQVRPLLPGQPGCVTLITSRHDLRGLAVSPGMTGVALGVLDHDDSVAVLADLLGPARAGTGHGELAELAGVCAHLPLALRIAAANLAADPGCSVAEYTTELTSRGRVTALAIDGDETSAVRAAFDQSYRRLSSGDQTLFRLLGLMPGPDTSTAATAALAGIGTSEARRALDRLVAAGLLHRTAPGRCAFHDLIRDYAADRARDDRVDFDPALVRLVDHYLRRATAAARVAFPTHALRDEPVDPGLTEAAAVRWLEDERPNLLAVVSFAAVRPAVQRQAWRMVDVLRSYLRARGHTSEAIAGSVEALRAAVAAGDRQACMSLLDLLGQIFYNLNEWERASEQHEQMLAIARELGDRDGEAEALRNIGMQVIQRGRPLEALRYHERSLVISRETGNVEEQSRTLNALGVARVYAGDPVSALTLHEQVLALAERLGHREMWHRGLNGRGIARWAVGRLDESAADHEQVLAFCRHAGQRVGEMASLACLAEVHLDAGRLDEARVAAEQTLRLCGELAERRAQVNMSTVIAAIHTRQGRASDALATLLPALGLAREIGFGFGTGAALLGAATAHRALHEPRTALTCADEALTLFRGNQQLLLEADVLIELGLSHAALGDQVTATATLHEAVAVAARQGRELVARRAGRALRDLC